MRTNISLVMVTEENVDELFNDEVVLDFNPDDVPKEYRRRFIRMWLHVWDPYEKYQIHPNFRGVRQGL